MTIILRKDGMIEIDPNILSLLEVGIGEKSVWETYGGRQARRLETTLEKLSIQLYGFFS